MFRFESVLVVVDWVFFECGVFDLLLDDFFKGFTLNGANVYVLEVD